MSSQANDSSTELTFVLTDVVGSTRLWIADPVAMDGALQRHDELVQGIVEAHGGRLVKSRGEGDSSFSVFEQPDRAADAALEVHAALAAEPWPARTPIRVRIAMLTGWAVERDGDFYGIDVNRVARLRGSAAGGEILVGQETADLLRAVGRHHLVELGGRVLKDLARIEQVWALSPTPAEDRPAVVAQPALARMISGQPRCVGREEELARLANLWEKAQGGSRQAVLIGGEPGIGKTSLAAAVARRAHDDGAMVLSGRCDEDLGVALQPFEQSLRALVAAVGDDHLRALGHHAAHLARLVPELLVRLPDLEAAVPADAEAERYSLFEAVVALLAGVAVDVPVLLVLDDLHWAARPTLLLLRHLLRADTDLRLMVVGTYRDTEVDRSHALSEMLADLRREVDVHRMALAGLDRGAIQTLVTETAGHELDGPGLELADTLHRRTGGNPFFVAEVLRHLAESGAIYVDGGGRWASRGGIDELGLPEGVRDVIGRRLSRLSDAANQAMTVAAVSGPVFELRLVEAILPSDLGVLDALDEGVVAGLLTEDGGTYAFPHALVRQTLLDELSTTRRLRHHRRIAEALEAVAPDAVESLAFHFAEAAVEGVAAQAADYALAAARRARARAAFEESTALLERGLEALEAADPVDRERRCDLLLELGELLRWLHRTGLTELGMRAADDARAVGSPVRLARAAAVAFNPIVGTPDPIGSALAEEALAALGDDEPGLRVDLLVLLALHRVESEGRREEGEALALEALRVAEGAPPEVAAAAMFASWRWRAQATIGQIEEVVQAIPPELHTAELLTFLAQERAAGALHAGDVARFDEVLEEIQALAALTHGWYPTYIGFAFTATRAILDGRWADAQAALDSLLVHADGDANAMNVWASNVFLVLREQGDLEGLLPLLEDAAASSPGVAGFRAAAGLIQIELGLVERAAETFAPLSGTGAHDIPRDQTFDVTFAMLAELAARSGDAASCEQIYERMTDPAVSAAGEVATVTGTITVGAGDRFLGMLAATSRRFDVAQRHYEAAIDLEERLGSRPYLARTRTWFARMLLDRAGPGDAARAAELLRAAVADAEDLGMPLVAAEGRTLLAAAG